MSDKKIKDRYTVKINLYDRTANKDLIVTN